MDFLFFPELREYDATLDVWTCYSCRFEFSTDERQFPHAEDEKLKVCYKCFVKIHVELGTEKLSNCCGATAYSNGDTSLEDFGYCSDCRDHCDYIYPGEE